MMGKQGTFHFKPKMMLKDVEKCWLDEGNHQGMAKDHFVISYSPTSSIRTFLTMLSGQMFNADDFHIMAVYNG